MNPNIIPKSNLSTKKNEQSNIKHKNRHGQLVLQLEDDDLKCYNLKDIKLKY